MDIIMNLFSRRIVSLELADKMDSQMILNAMNKAISSRNPIQNLIVHSERDSQYFSNLYEEFLAKNKFRYSVISPGIPMMIFLLSLFS